MTDKKPYFYDEKGQLNIAVRAVPFKAPVYLNEKDIQGHYFHPGTDTGVPMAVSYLDHNKITDRYPQLKSLPGINDRIGAAVRDLTDEEGIVYNIIVDERYRYKNMLKKLAEQHMLEGSTTPNQRSVIIDKSTGRIDRWEVAEVTLTWMPANPEAELIAKSIVLEEILMEEDKDTQVKTEETSTPADAQETVSSATPITDAITAILEAQPAEKSVTEILVSFEKSVTDAQAALAARQEAFEKSVNDKLNDIATALPAIAAAVSANLRQVVVEQTQRSGAERIVDKSIADKFSQGAAGQPSPNAPGRERKANFGGKVN